MINAIFIQARLKSTRLEKKVFKEYKGRTVIEYQIERLKHNCSYPIILLTSINSQDDPLAELCLKHDIPCFRGSEEDVIERFTQCAEKHNVENFYLIYGDEPFTDIFTLNETFKLLITSKELIVFNNHLPEGTYGYGFTKAAAIALNQKKTNFENEVWGEMVKKIGIRIWQKTSNNFSDDIRLTIDYQEDFIVFTKIIDYFNERIFSTPIDQIIHFYIENNLQQTNGIRIKDYKDRLIEQGKI
jgi:spore coat polysaccharide biosynthesis protein SpsF